MIFEELQGARVENGGKDADLFKFRRTRHRKTLGVFSSNAWLAAGQEWVTPFESPVSALSHPLVDHNRKAWFVLCCAVSADSNV